MSQYFTPIRIVLVLALVLFAGCADKSITPKIPSITAEIPSIASAAAKVSPSVVWIVSDYGIWHTF